MKIKKINDIEDDDKQDDDIEDDDIEDEKLVRIPIAAVFGFKEQIKPTTGLPIAKACTLVTSSYVVGAFVLETLYSWATAAPDELIPVAIACAS